MTPKQLVFMDIDGTLVDEQQHISAFTKQTIRQFSDQARFYVATGRMYASAKIIADEIGAGIIASNGSIFDAGTRQVKTLGSAALKQIITVLQPHPLNAFFFTDHQVFYTGALPSYFQHSDHNRIASPNPHDYIKVLSLPALLDHSAEIINGIIIAEDQESELNAINQQLAAMPAAFVVSSSQPNNIELIPQHSGKASAIKVIQAATGIDRHHTFVFGDGDNDVDMFGVADYAVAMGNATPAVQVRAQYVTGTNEQDGIAHFLLAHLPAEKGSINHG